MYIYIHVVIYIYMIYVVTYIYIYIYTGGSISIYISICIFHRNPDQPLTQELIENHLQVCHLQIKHDALCEELEAINKATESCWGK